MEENNLNEKNKEKNKGKRLWIIFIIVFIIICIGTAALYIAAHIIAEQDNCTQKPYYNPEYPSIDAKPIIYIYPTKTIDVKVKLGEPQNLICTYPKYAKEGWNITAQPDGTLTDKITGRKLYSLYWEGKDKEEFKVEKEGFCVEREKTAEFLEKKLNILGLNYKEQEEFIVYWLPKLEANKYNYIRFATMEEIEKNMPLEVSPAPDTLIRVLMAWKGLDEQVQVEEQQLTKIERNGYTVVEWGGTEIK